MSDSTNIDREGHTQSEAGVAERLAHTISKVEGRAVVALFGSTDAVATGPFSDRAVVVQRHLACSPCLKTHCATDFRCMLEIGVDEVFEPVRRLLAG